MQTLNLIELLKWPFCTGEAERLVLAELESSNRFNTRFHGSIGDFIQLVGQRPEWGPILNGPAKRPTAKEAAKELETVLAGRLH